MLLGSGLAVQYLLLLQKTVQLGEHPSDLPAALNGWGSIERKPFCDECLAQFTEEDREWCTQAPVPLGVAEIAHLLPGDIEPKAILSRNFFH